MFYRQPDAAYFDDLMMTFDETGSAYSYDSKGNLISASDNAQRNETYTFNSANELTQLTNDNNETYKYFYGDSNFPHRLTAARSQQRKNGFTYSYGTSDVLLHIFMGSIKDDGSEDYTKPYITDSRLYDVNTNYVNSYQDQRGNITSYMVNSDNGIVSYSTNPKGVTTNYTYNDYNYLTAVSATASQGVVHTVGYAYDDYWRLKKITHNGFDYEFTYDKWGNVTSTSAGGHTLSTNTYALTDGSLTKTTYGNGDYIEYTYDKYDRVTAKKVNGTVTEEYIYNNKGQTARCIDRAANLTYEYSYDLIGRLTEVRRSDSVSFSYQYDDLNRLKQKTFYINGEKHTQNYTYYQDSLPYTASFDTTVNSFRLYDSLNRLTGINMATAGIISPFKMLSHQFGYENVSGQRTTTLVNSHSMRYSQNGMASPLIYFDDSYIYDANGNISSISRLQNGQTQNLSYEYDGLDQLVRVNDQKASTTTLYTYDAGGNITSAKTYPYTTGAVSGAPLSQNTYAYSSSGWKDLLTNFNGDSILYDEIGNPTQYRDGMTFNWESGRQLSSVTQGDSAYSYSYDASGTRISKTVNGSTYSYIYDNGQLIYADTPVGGMTFIYDNDSVIGYKYNSAYYYYLKNLQGDILGAVDASGNLLYQYQYDAWGNPTVLDAQGSVISPSASHVANSNPLRYRGYFFDTETGFYLTGTRYYDPVTCRFINADTAAVLTASPDSLYDKNLFAYCDNNPITRVDSDGEFWDTLLDIVSVVVSVVDVITNPTDATAWASLGADVVSLAVPGFTGGGAIVKAITKADDVADAVKTVKTVKKVNKAANTVKTVDNYSDAAKIVNKTDFFVTPMGDAIPATRQGFYNNLSKMELKGGKYYGIDSRGKMRVRVEQHTDNPASKAPYNPFHSQPHFHIDRKEKIFTGDFITSFTGLMEWLRWK